MVKMKIVFHIPRMNWYRVLAPIINEALKRKHDVECWHHSGVKTLGENRPNRLRVPSFKFGFPHVIEYEKSEDIVQLIRDRSPSIVVDIYPPRYKEIIEDKCKNDGLPHWLLVDLPPSDCILEIQSDRELYGCDSFVICNEYYLDSSVEFGKQNKQEILSFVKSMERKVGKNSAQFISTRFMYQLGNEQEKYIRAKALIVGNASFDHFPLLDRKAIRKKYGIAETQRVVVVLPCPFGYDFTAPWEQLYTRGNFFRRLLWMITSKRFDCIIDALTLPCNTDVLRTLRRFADSNNALLIGKLRHSRSPAPEVRRYCHLLIGDDDYYPHTAVELFSIADLVAGHYSSGAIEAVAVGAPYLNIEIPGFPKKFYCDTYTPIRYCDHWPGVIWSMTAREVVSCLHLKLLQEFQISETSQEEYLRKFASYPLGGASERIIDYLERKI